MSNANNAPFVFISYAHKDAAVVLPCIEALKRKNINVWYDAGIQAGSEWPEYIAEKVFHCTKFIAFISSAYLESQNCKRELNFAISKKKDLLSVFVEDVQLSLGVEMQLGTYQSIFKSRYGNETEFYESLSNEPWLTPCKVGTQQAPRQTSTTAYSQPSGSNTWANPQAAPTQRVATPTPQPTPVYGGMHSVKPSKNRYLAAILAIFLGAFGIQYFYLGQIKKGLLCVVFYWTFIPTVLGWLQGLQMLLMSDQSFKAKYRC